MKSNKLQHDYLLTSESLKTEIAQSVKEFLAIMESECPMKCVIQPTDPTLNHSIHIYAQFTEHPFNNALPSAPSSTVYSVQVSQSKSCMHFSLSAHLIPFPFITVRLRFWRRCQIMSFIMQVFTFSRYSIYVCCYLFSWRYNPLWLYFHSPIAGFSLRVFEVSWPHTTTRHSR
jgi:hypothetical protein